jgi:hypothetical protein
VDGGHGGKIQTEERRNGGSLSDIEVDEVKSTKWNDVNLGCSATFAPVRHLRSCPPPSFLSATFVPEGIFSVPSFLRL